MGDGVWGSDGSGGECSNEDERVELHVSCWFELLSGLLILKVRGEGVKEDINWDIGILLSWVRMVLDHGAEFESGEI